MATTPKIQRWIDLLAALLRHHYPVTLEQLIREVPAYGADQRQESLRRTFERDKDELRRFGVPIETVPAGEGEPVGYRLRVRDFYLPYLAVRTDTGAKPRKLDPYGYRSLPSLSFEPDELAAVADAAARVRALGDPLLAEHAESAMRKLACDLPVDAAGRPDATLAPPKARPDPDLLVTLHHALESRKRVTLNYRAMDGGAGGSRTLEPLGLFFLNGHWYLAARAPGEKLVKNFRLNRMSDLDVNQTRPNSRDYEIPADFDLREHARSRHAWELGSGDAIVTTVAFHARSGAAAAASHLGEEVPGHPDRRSFRVRRSDAFARWLLSFGGNAVPLSPGEVVQEYQGLVRETLAHHSSYRPTAVPPYRS